ncbi:hypothetical protein OQ483_24010 (plasmid) [Enterobacter bugandensis]|uniref:hypothetical protein n=1 Tax=Enterobacter bugandensis TaxID=881260 RepID=UPI00283A8E7B|nr:hypothetical protein [Enterobacter bugandensis]WMU75448.1 hypothetical protein OQ483_24010 [Enterobacter bugandensis]
MAKYGFLTLKLKQIRCNKESTNDQMTATDEMYVHCVSVDNKKNVHRFLSSTYKDIDTGQTWNVYGHGRYNDGDWNSNTLLSGPAPLINRALVSFDLWEEDNAAARDWLAKASKDVANEMTKSKKFHDSLDPIAGPTPEGRDVSEGAAALFDLIGEFFSNDVLNLGDDHIGNKAIHIYDIDYKAGTFAVKHGPDIEGPEMLTREVFGQDFWISNIGNTSEGSYSLALSIDLTFEDHKVGTVPSWMEEYFIPGSDEEEKAAAQKRKDIIERARNLPSDQFNIIFSPLGGTGMKDVIFNEIIPSWGDMQINALERAMNETRNILDVCKEMQ